MGVHLSDVGWAWEVFMNECLLKTTLGEILEKIPHTGLFL